MEPIFSVSNTEFEGGDDGHSHGEGTFLVKQAQPSHIVPVEANTRGPYLRKVIKHSRLVSGAWVF
jgi:hypothetical protein